MAAKTGSGMRRPPLWVALGLLILGVGVAAEAAPLNFDGVLCTELDSDLPTWENDFGGVATVNSSAGEIPADLQTLRVKASRIGTTGSGPVGITAANGGADGIASIRLDFDGLGTGDFYPIHEGAISTTNLTSRVLPIRGLAKLCLLSTACTQFIPIELTQNGTRGLGIGGLITGGKATAGIRISIEAAPWTIKTATLLDQITTPNTPGGVKQFVNVTSGGFAHGPSTTTASTAQPSGIVQLITPMQVVTNLTSGSNAKLSLFSALRIRFVPEPDMLLLLGSGVIGLVVLGRSRLRR
jgi:hypothetical protein